MKATTQESIPKQASSSPSGSHKQTNCSSHLHTVRIDCMYQLTFICKQVKDFRFIYLGSPEGFRLVNSLILAPNPTCPGCADLIKRGLVRSLGCSKWRDSCPYALFKGYLDFSHLSHLCVVSLLGSALCCSKEKVEKINFCIRTISCDPFCKARNQSEQTQALMRKVQKSSARHQIQLNYIELMQLRHAHKVSMPVNER